MVSVGVTGQMDLYKLARAFKNAGQKELGKKLDKGIRAAAKVIETAVTDRRSTDAHIPRDFEAEFHKSLKAKHEVRMLRGRSVSITFTAMGKKGPRKLDFMERGILEHPIFGRGRRLKDGRFKKNKWVKAPNQKIRPGVVSEPAMKAQPEAVKTLGKAVKDLVHELNSVT